LVSLLRFGYLGPGRLKFLVREVLQASIEVPPEEREVSRDLSIGFVQ